MKQNFAIALLSIVFLCIFGIFRQVRADDLPRGVPHAVDTNGNVFYVDPMFTTPAFQEEGLRFVLEEANRVARDLRLPEQLPITKSNLTHAFIAPFGYTYIRKRLGNITTSNYSYNVGQDFKFSDLTVAKYDETCKKYYEKYQWPIRRLDTNAPYLLATQWLAAVRMDVEGLNRDCDVHVGVDPYWNGVELGELPKNKFTPLYFVWWTPRSVSKSKTGAAQVELFLPTKTLIQLNVYDAKYILRPPLVFTNLEALFPGQAKITTNYPSKPIIIDGSKWPTDKTHAAPENVK
jgi:hypothetical protein